MPQVFFTDSDRRAVVLSAFEEHRLLRVTHSGFSTVGGDAVHVAAAPMVTCFVRNCKEMRVNTAQELFDSLGGRGGRRGVLLEGKIQRKPNARKPKIYT